jgi:energy-coupling factor transporter ATP-binding protein EcfA2
VSPLSRRLEEEYSVIGEHDPRGSVWRRWDPHLHAPGTVLNDQFGADSLDAYLTVVESAGSDVVALGVTDYLSTACYERVLAAVTSDGRLPGVKLLFPNIELRLVIGTNKGKGINLHLLASPDDPDHILQISRILGRLWFEYKNDKFHCKRDELIMLGKAFNPALTDDEAAHKEGVNQFKVDFAQLRHQLDESAWAKRNILTAVAVGTNDGTSGLQTDDSGFAAVRQEIEAFADIIFASSPSQVKFWLGDGSDSLAALERKYRGAKPCMHGSDAHKLEQVCQPHLDRFTWIKGDPIFESLRQVCLEPRGRVFIGPCVPELQSPEQTLDHVRTIEAPWLLDGGLSLNPGMVAVIGARGSGKTALADLLAHGSGSALPLGSDKSFLRRAAPFLTRAEVSLTWSSGDEMKNVLASTDHDAYEEVHYLSQQFVDRLCSAESASDELLTEIQKVVFNSHPPAERLEATSFAELVNLKSGNTRLRRQYLRDRLDQLADEVQSERAKIRGLPTKQRALRAIEASLKESRASREKIILPGGSDRTKYYERLRGQIDGREKRLQSLSRVSQAVDHLDSEVRRYLTGVLPDIEADLRNNNKSAGLRDDDWEAFALGFKGQPATVLIAQRAKIAAALANHEKLEGPAPTLAMTEEQLKVCSLAKLRTAFDTASQEIGVDQRNAQRLQALNEQIRNGELEHRKLTEQISTDQGAEERLKAHFERRTRCYEEFFDLVVQEEQILQDLYVPLEAKLASAGDTTSRLRLKVVRRVDVDAWAARGEELIDLRKTGKFKGKGAIADFARESLLPAWETGTAADVSGAMAAFRADYDAAIQAQSGVERNAPEYHQWVLDVGRWLYTTDHIQVTYSFEYEGTSLVQLSPGTRGIVLLLLYLALDLEDRRPLIIDQPEENLDPKSVFRELVELFSLARNRRQVIIVTHNANLVVNTDVDQVIVASCARPAPGQPPIFSYKTGGLENPSIRSEVCEILEGGEAAFKQRARRLRVESF